MDNTLEIKKPDYISEGLNKTYNLAIDHAIETVRSYLQNDIAILIIEKLEKLKS